MTKRSLDAMLAAGKELFGPGPGRLFALITEAFERIDWAEEEVRAAIARYPEKADLIYHSIDLLRPNEELGGMGTRFVYQGHCRELLERFVKGEDTRPGTAAEVCCGLMGASLRAPMRSEAVGLYLRMWKAAGFPEFDGFAAALEHHEALEESLIDLAERHSRRKLAVAERRWSVVEGAIECEGVHYGEEVRCAYVPSGQLGFEI